MLESILMQRIASLVTAIAALWLINSCQSSNGTSPGLRMDYVPTIAIAGGTESFSTKAEPFTIGVIYEVERGFVDRIDVELNGQAAGSHFIVDKVSRGKFQFDVDASALPEGVHSLKIYAFQGERFARNIKSSTDTMKFVVIK